MGEACLRVSGTKPAATRHEAPDGIYRHGRGDRIRIFHHRPVGASDDAAAVYTHMMLIHAGAPLAPHDLWAAWSFEPLVVSAIGASAFLYGRGYLIALSRSTRGTKGLHMRAAAFGTGLL